MWLRAGSGILLCAVGAVFMLQGTNVLHGSGMSAQGKWTVIGAIVVAVGLVLIAMAARSWRHDSGGPD
jgi:hypothetical protein